MIRNIFIVLFSLPIITYAQEINEKKLIVNIKYLSSDELAGRRLGTSENVKAREYIAEEFKQIGLEAAIKDSYIQNFKYDISSRYRKRLFREQPEVKRDTFLFGANVVASIKGETDKVIAITAHFDHLGIREGEIFNGADDNASGTAALIAIGEYFLKHPTKHTLILAAVDGEEMGMPGSKKLVEDFPGGIAKVVLNVNMDMIAHNDNNEIYACGTYYFPKLKEPIKSVKSSITVLFGHDNPEVKGVQDWSNSSDHKSFYDKDIPFVYFGVEDHKDYHKSTDTFENINQDFYINAVRLIIQAIEKLDKSI